MKSKRTVTVDSSSCKDDEKPSRRPSVFDRLGPGALSSSSKERHPDRQEKCRNWLRNGECAFGNLCKYEHPVLKPAREKTSEASEYRKKSKSKRDDISRSPSPALGKHKRDKQALSSSFRSRSDYETKLRSTIVKPKSPENERYEKHSKGDAEKRSRRNKKEVLKKPLEQQWEEDEQEDSDDWDATKLDYKEALTLEMKRQELQRELEEIEGKEEPVLKDSASDEMENVVISKRLASSSSSSSSSSRSSSASSSSVSSSSSSSFSGSASDSDSSDSSSASSARNKKPRSRKKSSSPNQRKSKRSNLSDSKTMSGKSRLKKAKGPRTPSPTKMKRARNEFESSDYNRGDGKARNRQKKGEEDVRRRYSNSPSNSLTSSEVTNKERNRKTYDEKKSHRRKTTSSPPPAAYSGNKRDRSDISNSQNQPSSYKRSDHHPRQLSPTKDRHSRHESESLRRDHSPPLLAGRSKDGRQRSNSPKDSHVLEKSKYASDRRRSASPSRTEQIPGRREHRSKDIIDKVPREEGRHAAEQYSPSRGRNREAKVDRYSSYYDESDVRRARSPHSPGRGGSRREYRDVPLQPREILPPHAERDILQDRHKDKIHDSRGIYRGESPRHHRAYDDKYAVRDDRLYRESDYHRSGLHERDYPPTPLREHDIGYRGLDGRRDPAFHSELPRERDYARHDVHERDYYPRDLPYPGHRSDVRRPYAGHMEPDDVRRDPAYDIHGRERIRDRYMDPRDRVDDRYPPLHPNDEMDHHQRRRSRHGHYLPEEEQHGKRDWAPPYADYPDHVADRYGYGHLDYPMEASALHPHAWDQHPREEGRDNRDVYYNNRRHSRVEDIGGKRRQENSPSVRADWEFAEYKDKRSHAPVDRDDASRRDRSGGRDKNLLPEGSRDRDRGRNDSHPHTLGPDKDTGKPWDDRRGRKRGRSMSSERYTDQNPEKRSRLPVDSRPDDWDRRRYNVSEDRKLSTKDAKVDDGRSSKRRSDARDDGSQYQNKRADSPETSVKDDASEKSSKAGSVDDRSRHRRDKSHDIGKFRRRSPSGENSRRRDGPAEGSRTSSIDGGSVKDGRSSRAQSDSGRDEMNQSREDKRSRGGMKESGGEALSERASDDDDGDVGTIEENQGKKANDDAEKESSEWKKELSDKQLKSDEPIKKETEDRRLSSASTEKSDTNSNVDVDEKAEANKSSVPEEKECEEELSDWSDAEDELLCRDELNGKHTDDPTNTEKGVPMEENAEKKVQAEPFSGQRKNRVEEIKSEHNNGSSRSVSRERQQRDSSNRSLSSERSRSSQERSRDRRRNRRGRDLNDRYHDKDRSSSYGSRSSSRNTSLERTKSDSGRRSREKLRVSEKSGRQDDALSNVDNFDYDPISDDEFEAMIEEPADTDQSETNTSSKKPGIVDALNVDWESLMGSKENLTSEPVRTKATQRFKPGRIFSEIGFSASLVTPELAARIKKVCNEELQKESAENGEANEDVKFEFKHDVAALHAAVMTQVQERKTILTDIGPYRRALCARQDLQIRRKLCRFHQRLPDHLASVVTATQHNVDPELYQMSVQLFKNACKRQEVTL